LVSGVNAASGSGTGFNGVLEARSGYRLVGHVTTRMIKTALNGVVVARRSSEDCVICTRTRQSRADFATDAGSSGGVSVVQLQSATGTTGFARIARTLEATVGLRSLVGGHVEIVSIPALAAVLDTEVGDGVVGFCGALFQRHAIVCENAGQGAAD